MDTARIAYTNYRGERAVREIQPIRVYFGSTKYHPKPQWLLHAYDVEKKDVRDFAMADIDQWFRSCNPPF